MRYYEYSLFHRIEKDFIAQAGDPTATGKGGESIFALLLGGPRFFEDELRGANKAEHMSLAKKGMLGMANSGKNKNASQFFITLADGLEYLDESYTPFGQLQDEESLKTLDLINNAMCDSKFKPLQKVWIKRVEILDDPYDDPEGLIIPASVRPSEAFVKFLGVDAADVVEVKHSMPAEELEFARKRAEAGARALTLEMLGDLPSADVKPPENVLFVCKLNPMTEDEDLATVFSRFGTILSCQIIRDKETRNSLGYAFIEFEQAESCEQAYFKMDKVLLDDRRIHVDFSQSVSRLHGMWEKARRQQLRNIGGLSGIELKDKGSLAARKYEMVFDEREVRDAYSDRDSKRRERSQSRDRHYNRVYDRYDRLDRYDDRDRRRR